MAPRRRFPATVPGHFFLVLLLRAPGVYTPQTDTWLLAEALHREHIAPGAQVLDVGTGTGALAVLAARAGGSVTAVDTSRRALATTWLNARARGLRVRVRHGNLLHPVAGERFDVIVTNPPYVPAHDDRLPQRGPSRAWDAGTDGRALLDRICAQAPQLLAPGGVLLVVHSALCGPEVTVARLADTGLQAEVVARRELPFGPVLRSRVGLLERRGLIAAGQRHEQLVVVRAVAPSQTSCRSSGSTAGPSSTAPSTSKREP